MYSNMSPATFRYIQSTISCPLYKVFNFERSTISWVIKTENNRKYKKNMIIYSLMAADILSYTHFSISFKTRNEESKPKITQPPKTEIGTHLKS